MQAEKTNEKEARIERYEAGKKIKRVGTGRTATLKNMLSDVKPQICRLLTSYMYRSAENLSVYIDVVENGEYILNVRAVTESFIESGKHV